MATVRSLYQRYVKIDNPAGSDYFGLIRSLLALRDQHRPESPTFVAMQQEIDRAYGLLRREMIENSGHPMQPVSFGTSGWRGILGKDLFVKSVGQVAAAIVAMYQGLEKEPELAAPLGVKSLAEARQRGCVLGHDNRFGGELLAGRVCDVLTSSGFVVHRAGEATTGTLSAAVLEKAAAFSINLTPSHNPLDYGGFKYNAADGGPAALILTNRITAITRELMARDQRPALKPDPALIRPCDALATWISLVRKNRAVHGLDYDRILTGFGRADDLVLAVDCMHGASRNHIRPLFKGVAGDRLIVLRGNNDPTFGGIAPEPSPVNMALANQALGQRSEPLKLGVLIDPDGDRIRFTDGTVDIDMNRFGALAYYYLHEVKKLPGMVAKTVATSNFANALAAAFGEEVFEPRVGFKEFKPVIGRALVCFEESDGITVRGHTPEKDAYIGLLLALDMVLTLRKNLGNILKEIETRYGSYFAAKDGVTVSRQGDVLLASLSRLEKYSKGVEVKVGGRMRRIARVIDIDGRKMIFEDNSWLMIRPSGTEPKVRFYVESRTREGLADLFQCARRMLAEAGLV
ncbi:MAG: phosphoglucomutase [Desulfobacterales bacterium]|nr:phosphoglucomutase [Desulfobacterales bacterium]